MTKPNKSSLLFIALITLLLTGLAATSYAYAVEIPEGYESVDSSCSETPGSVSRHHMAQLSDERLFEMVSHAENGSDGAMLKSVGKSSFKSIYKKAVVKVPAKKVKAYAKLLRKGSLPKFANVRK